MYDFMIGRPFITRKDSIAFQVGRIGYKVLCPTSTIAKLGDEEIKLFLHLQVREDSQTLFGFYSEEEREMFEILINTNGVGPKLGIDILSTYTTSELQEFVMSESVDRLKKVPGLGMKKAQKLIIECKEKIAKMATTTGIGTDPLIMDEITTGLQALGYNRREILNAMDKDDKFADAQEGIKTLLQQLSVNKLQQ